LIETASDRKVNFSLNVNFDKLSNNVGKCDRPARIVIIAKLEDSSSMIRDRMPVVGVDNLVLIVEIMSAGWN
jgi:hypothetical protein